MGLVLSGVTVRAAFDAEDLAASLREAPDFFAELLGEMFHDIGPGHPFITDVMTLLDHTEDGDAARTALAILSQPHGAEDAE